MISLIFFLGVPFSMGASVSVDSLDEDMSLDYRKKIELFKYSRIIKNIRGLLEEIHVNKSIKFNDQSSRLMYKNILKKVDPSQELFTQKDLRVLAKNETLIDDYMRNGSTKFAQEIQLVVNNKVDFLEKFLEKFFSQDNISLNSGEFIELDIKKRKVFENDKALLDYWKKRFLNAIAGRYLTLKENNESASDKEKKMELEIVKKAMTDTKKRYYKYFESIKKMDLGDYVAFMVNGAAQVYDPHTLYMSKDDFSDFNSDMSGSLEGIGAMLGDDDGFIEIKEIISGGAAWSEDKLKEGDLIMAIFNEKGERIDLTESTVDEAAKLIRGPKGTSISFEIKRKGVQDRLKIEIIRDRVDMGLSYVKHSILKYDGGDSIGYIKVPMFYRDLTSELGGRAVSSDVLDSIKYLKSQKVKGIVLDLRNNGGGALVDATRISGFFIPQGPIVQIKDYNGTIQLQQDTDPTTQYEGPLVILINRASASASEIVAAAMQDYNRAIIIGGDSSYGKGTVQGIFELDKSTNFWQIFPRGLGAIKMTMSKFYRVNGESTQYKGVVPDIKVPDLMEVYVTPEKDVEYSLKWDKISASDYSPKISFFDKKDIINSSKSRLKKSKDFNTFSDLIKEVKSLKEVSTKVPLSLEVRKEWEKKYKNLEDHLEMDSFLDPKLEVVGYLDNKDFIKEDLSGKNKERWVSALSKQNQEWVEKVRKDIVLREGMVVIQDIIEQGAQKASSLGAKK